MTGVFLTPRQPLPINPLQPTHPLTPNAEDGDKEQADAVEKAFDMDYDVAQAFCSHIIPRVVLLFAGEAPDNCKDFEPDDGEGYDDRDNEGGDDEGGGGKGLPFPASAKIMGEL